MLRHYICPLHNDWDEHLIAAEFAVNNGRQESTHMTPFMMNYGHHLLTLATLRTPRVDNPQAMVVTGALQERMAYAKKCMEAAQQRRKAYADRSRRPEFKVVQVRAPQHCQHRLQRPGAPKLMPWWIGPHKIVREIPHSHGTAYNMRLLDVFHVSLLKPYQSDGRGKPPPPELSVDGEIEYEV
jgi:hypothetical protein